MRHEKSRFIEVFAGGYIREIRSFLRSGGSPSASFSIVQFFSRFKEISRRTEISRGIIHRSFSYRCVHRHWCRLCHTFCSHFCRAHHLRRTRHFYPSSTSGKCSISRRVVSVPVKVSGNFPRESPVAHGGVFVVRAIPLALQVWQVFSDVYELLV